LLLAIGKKHPNALHPLPLLRGRDERPSRSTANPGNEIPPSHVASLFDFRAFTTLRLLDHRQRALLRAHRERPCRGAAKPGDEIASSHF